MCSQFCFDSIIPLLIEDAYKVPGSQSKIAKESPSTRRNGAAYISFDSNENSLIESRCVQEGLSQPRKDVEVREDATGPTCEDSLQHEYETIHEVNHGDQVRRNRDDRRDCLIISVGTKHFKPSMKRKSYRMREKTGDELPMVHESESEAIYQIDQSRKRRKDDEDKQKYKSYLKHVEEKKKFLAKSVSFSNGLVWNMSDLTGEEGDCTQCDLTEQDPDPEQEREQDSERHAKSGNILQKFKKAGQKKMRRWLPKR